MLNIDPQPDQHLPPFQHPQPFPTFLIFCIRIYKRNFISLQSQLEKPMIQNIKAICKEQINSLDNSHLVVIQENVFQHSDFLIINWLINELQNQKKTVFIGLRQNYAHYLSLSKKMGKSIQPFLKSKQLVYYQAFIHQFCSQLPLTQSSPSSYITPPKHINQIKMQELSNIKLQNNTTIFIDCLQFMEQNDLMYALYQQSVLQGCRIIMGGCQQGNKTFQILKNEAQMMIRLQNDVGGYGKFRICSSVGEVGLLWRWMQGSFEVTKFIKT